MVLQKKISETKRVRKVKELVDTKKIREMNPIGKEKNSKKLEKD